MEEIKLLATALVRTPSFSYSEGMEANWDALKRAISHSSPEFYNLISEMTYEQVQRAEHRIRLTVLKYYNRATFRSTPYGHFASVSSASIASGSQSGIILSGRQTSHSFADWSQRPKDNEQLEDLKQSKALLFSNTTFYRLKDEIRFVQKSDDKLVLSAVDYDPIISEILEICSLPQNYLQLAQTLPALDPKVLDEYISGMLELGLLITSLGINIIGEDYFRRTGRHNQQAKKQYLISERKSVQGSLDKNMFRHLPELVGKLKMIVPVNKLTDLDEFKSKFIRRFEQAEVPIMIALDPDAGIGYGALYSNIDQPGFAKVFAAVSEKKEPGPRTEHLRNMLYKEILSKNGNGIINLEDILTDELLGESGHLPNSFSAMGTPVDHEIFLEMIGGATAMALPGRFALAVPGIFQQCREIVQIEQKANPSVLFFDIGYVKEDQVDNINRRPCIYENQLCLLNFDTSTSPLPVHDILISVQMGEVVLRSKRYDKRIIPRFASAYNHVRSDMPLYRLLMDIQSQGLTTSLGLKPMSLIPGLPYYPRIQFKNVVVSPASWRLSKSIVANVTERKARIGVLQDFLWSVLPCPYFKTGKGDQTLFLSINAIPDMETLLSILEKEAEVYIEEAYKPTNPCVKDVDGKPFLPQVILTLFHTDQIYKPLGQSLYTTPAVDQKDWIGPGKHWLYFEIFCNHIVSDFLMQDRIGKFLKANKSKINSWFFIRYNENGDHLRLRLRIRDLAYGYQIMGGLTDLLNEDLQAGVISEIKVKTYKREVNRYSRRLMGKVEDHFFRDSKFVLSLLPLTISDMKKYKLCTDILDAIASSGVMVSQSFDLAIRNVMASFNKEHGVTTNGFKELNKLYSEFLKAGLPHLDKSSTGNYHSFQNSFVKLLSDCDAFNRPALMVDLMHMHVNRLFAGDQRKHETLIYNFYNLLSKRRTMRMDKVSDRRA